MGRNLLRCASIPLGQARKVMTVKGITGVAVASTRVVIVLVLGAVCPRMMGIANVVKVMDLLFIQEERGSNGMNGRVAPSLIEEATGAIEVVEVVEIALRAPEAKIANLKVAPKVTGVPLMLCRIKEEVIGVGFGYILGMLVDEVSSCFPQRRYSIDKFATSNRKSISFIVELHEQERIVVDVAVELDPGLNAPIVVEICCQVMSEKEARLVATHVSVGLRVAIG